MSLKKCKECGQQISSEAKKCPHCGKPQSQSGAIIGGVVLLAVVVLIIYSLGKGDFNGFWSGFWNSFKIAAEIDHYNKGVEFQQTGQIELAEQQFRLALEKDPNFAETHLNLGWIYIDRGWYEGGEKSTKQAIKLFEQNKDTLIEGSTWKQALSLAYNNLGIIEIAREINEESKLDYFKAKANWEKAMSFFQKAIELDPLNSQAQSNIKKFQDAY